MTRFCDACGSPKAFIQVGGAMLCKTCDVEIMEIVRQKREAGESRISVLAEARKIFREQNSAGSYLIKDFPAELKKAAQDAADKAGISLREFILQRLQDAI